MFDKNEEVLNSFEYFVYDVIILKLVLSYPIYVKYVLSSVVLYISNTKLVNKVDLVCI